MRRQVNNVRAAVFPHLQQQGPYRERVRGRVFLLCFIHCLPLVVCSSSLLPVQNSMALSMSRQAWDSVESLERLHAWRCGKTPPSLKAVQAVTEEGQEKRKDGISASTAASDGMPPVTATEAFLGSAWSGNLWPFSHSTTAAPALRENPEDAAAAAEAHRASTAAAASYAATSPTAPVTAISANSSADRFLASERWLVQRCDGVQLYRVQYFGNGDAFYAQVVPTNASGLAAKTWIGIRNFLRI
jgi:hypothetical protein